MDERLLTLLILRIQPLAVIQKMFLTHLFLFSCDFIKKKKKKQIDFCCVMCFQFLMSLFQIQCRLVNIQASFTNTGFLPIFTRLRQYFV